MQGALGKGCNGSVLAAASRHFPNVVLKKSDHTRIRTEAEHLWRLRHPNVIHAYAVLESQEHDNEGNRMEYLALERLGPSLLSRMVAGERYNTPYSPALLACCALIAYCQTSCQMTQQLLLSFWNTALSLLRTCSKLLVATYRCPQTWPCERRFGAWRKIGHAVLCSRLGHNCTMEPEWLYMPAK